jgi:hypothetical protein
MVWDTVTQKRYSKEALKDLMDKASRAINEAVK